MACYETLLGIPWNSVICPSILHLIPRKCKISELWWVFWMLSQQNSKQLLKWAYKNVLGKQPASSLLITAWFTFILLEPSFSFWGVWTTPSAPPKVHKQFSKIHGYISRSLFSIWIISPNWSVFDGGRVGLLVDVSCNLKNKKKVGPTPDIRLGLGVQETEQGNQQEPGGCNVGWGGWWDPESRTLFSQGQQTFEMVHFSWGTNNYNWGKKLQKTLLV